MSAPLDCSWCAAGFWSWTELGEHEDWCPARPARSDFETQGAAARAAGTRFDDCPHPARTWPEIEWRRGWLLADLRRDAA